MTSLIALIGLMTFAALAWAFSEQRRAVPWRTVLWGLGAQLALGALVFWAPGSGTVMLAFSDAVAAALDAGLAGARLVFGPLAAGPGQPGSIGVVLACQVFPIAIVISALSALAYQLGLVQPLVRVAARALHRLLGISGAEALTSSANIFVGVESALVVRPYLLRMTRSELLVLLTCGMATSASTVLGLYVLTLKDVFPTIAGHLAICTVMAIPAAILCAKLIIPETGAPETAAGVPVAADERTAGGALGAVLNGAMDGLKLVAGLIAALIAVLALVAFADLLLGVACGWCGVAKPLTLVGLASWLFYPLAWLTSIDARDVGIAAQLFAKRLVAGEYLAYLDLVAAAKSGKIHDPRTVVIVSYVLCGFAHVASLAIFVGGTAAVVPERRDDLARLGPKALLAATLATLMTGAVAGIFCRGGEVVLGQ